EPWRVHIPVASVRKAACSAAGRPIAARPARARDSPAPPPPAGAAAAAAAIPAAVREKTAGGGRRGDGSAPLALLLAVACAGPRPAGEGFAAARERMVREQVEARG